MFINQAISTSERKLCTSYKYVLKGELEVGIFQENYLLQQYDHCCTCIEVVKLHSQHLQSFLILYMTESLAVGKNYFHQPHMKSVNDGSINSGI